MGDNRTIYIGSTKQKYLSQALQTWIQYYKTAEPLSYDIELLQSAPCNSIDELNKARQTFRGKYSHVEAEPAWVEAPKVEVRKVARLESIPEIPRKVGLTQEDVRRLIAGMF